MDINNPQDGGASVSPEEAGVAASSDAGVEKKKKKKAKKEQTLFGSRRGVETMFRSAYRAHLDLTSLADAKANIMISINGLILSIILATMSPKLDTNTWLVVPTVVMLISCVVAIVFAVLAARPRGKAAQNLTLAEALSRDVNLLYFGNSAQLSEDDFVTGLTEMVQDTDILYRNMMRDIYGMATVLKRKFGLLRSSYTVFMFGISISVLAFIMVFILETQSVSP